jgi:DNA topoisomerase-1
MQKVLVIVESPAKCKNIEKYLNAESDDVKYIVRACFGHVRDLDKKTLGVDVERGFRPKYVNIIKKNIKDDLKRYISQVDRVLLATDNDGAGESIAWHLTKLLQKTKQDKWDRIVFNEITPDAVRNSLQHMRPINMNRVSAQETRRILDRLMGYTLSPLLWKSIKQKEFCAMSAGRVQSAVLNMIVERERGNTCCTYWSPYISYNGYVLNNNSRILTLGLAQEFVYMIAQSLDLSALNDVKPSISEYMVNPPSALNTCSLQQKGFELGFDANTTMKLAQGLFESGHITYIRTESTHTSEQFVKQANAHIIKTFGASYVGNVENTRHEEEAHEAIRPTRLNACIKDPAASQLFDLIKKYAIQSLMSPAIYDNYAMQIDINGHIFKGCISNLKFGGFMGNVRESVKPICGDTKIGALQIGALQIGALQIEENRNVPFTGSTLIAKLEKQGIGRPSTYATIIAKLYDRRYIEDFCDQNNALYIDVVHNEPNRKREIKQCIKGIRSTIIGKQVVDVLNQHAPKLMDVEFTKNMEQQLDKIEDGRMMANDVLGEYWKELTRCSTIYGCGSM